MKCRAVIDASNEVGGFVGTMIHPLRLRSKKEFIELLKNRLRGRVEEAYIFGSIARDDFDNLSDLDLILIAETDKKFVNRFKDFEDIFELAPDLDLLVYTRGEFDAIRQSPPSPFWELVFKEAERVL